MSTNYEYIKIYVKYIVLTQLSVTQLVLKDVSHLFQQLHVSARFYGAVFRLSF